MSENEFDDIGGSEGISSLRKAYKKQKDELAEMRAQLSAINATNTRNELDTVFRLRGVDPRVVKFYPADRPTTVESVDEWLTENSDLFGVPENSGGPAPSSLTATEIEGYQMLAKIQAAEAATQTDFESRLKNANSQEEVIAMMKEFGAQHTF